MAVWKWHEGKEKNIPKLSSSHWHHLSPWDPAGNDQQPHSVAGLQSPGSCTTPALPLFTACSYSVLFALREPAACSVIWRRWDKTVENNMPVDRNYCRLLVGCACVCPFSPLGDSHIPTISTTLSSTQLRPVSSCRRVQNMCLSVPVLEAVRSLSHHRPLTFSREK